MDSILAFLVFSISLAAAFIDVMVGGSSLIIIPAFAVLGIPVLTVIATNRLYVVVFVLTGLLNYIRNKVKLDMKMIAGFLIIRVIGAFTGSLFVVSIPVALVKTIVAVFMFAALAAIVLLRSRENKHAKPNKNMFLLACVAMLLLGFYEGAVGGGAGTISRIILVAVLGYALIEAALAELVMSFAASSVASIVFVFSGSVDFVLLIPMVAGGIIGAYAGSHFALKKGEAWIRSLLYVVSAALLLKLLFFS
ncbi:Sulfite exporter TauE/SafE [uncultured archaeon]|nr:Sulfite exporter TauE/SafE [uncultured archaeon]